MLHECIRVSARHHPARSKNFFFEKNKTYYHDATLFTHAGSSRGNTSTGYVPLSIAGHVAMEPQTSQSNLSEDEDSQFLEGLLGTAILPDDLLNEPNPEEEESQELALPPPFLPSVKRRYSHTLDEEKNDYACVGSSSSRLREELENEYRRQSTSPLVSGIQVPTANNTT